MTLEAAVEVFVMAFSRAKSRHGPYTAVRQGQVWVLQDQPGTRRSPRKAEVVATEADPCDVVRAVKDSGVGWHFVVHVGNEAAASLRAAYKSLGYRALASETLFVHDLADVPVLESDPPVRRVGSQGELASVPQRARQPRRFWPGDDLYGVWDDQTDHGWVERIIDGDHSYPSALHVHESSRGRGYGRALMSRLLQDDREQGLQASVLVASTAGARLYPHLGYREIAKLQLFSPLKRST